MRTPEEQAIYNAERPIYDAAAGLDKCAAMLATLRACLDRVHLPAAVACDHLDDTDDLLAIVAARLTRAVFHVGKEIDRLQDAETARFNAATFPDAANDDELLELTTARPAGARS